GPRPGPPRGAPHRCVRHRRPPPRHPRRPRPGGGSGRDQPPALRGGGARVPQGGRGRGGSPEHVKLLRAILLLALVPLATGVLVVTYQDASLTHWPGKATTRDQLREGTFPFVHPGASFGQPLAGNMNF